jgi:replication factor A1
MAIKANYEQLIQRIAKLAALDTREIERRVEAKRAKLSGLISKEGAAQVVAAELGISFDKQRYKISDLLPGMRKIEVIAKILSIFPVRTYTRGGTPSKVANMIVADETSNIRVVLWDTNHISKIENGEIKQGTIVEIKNADVRGNNNKEIHLGSTSNISVSDKEIKNVVTSIQQELSLKKISELNVNENAKIKGAIVQIFQPKFFNVCPECNMKVSVEEGQFLCPRHGNIVPNERMLVNMVVDDGSENISAIGFNELVNKLFDIETQKLKDPQVFLQKKQELLAKEYFFSGRARKNMLFNRDEFVLNDIEEAVPEKIIEQFEK